MEELIDYLHWRVSFWNKNCNRSDFGEKIGHLVVKPNTLRDREMAVIKMRLQAGSCEHDVITEWGTFFHFSPPVRSARRINQPSRSQQTIEIFLKRRTASLQPWFSWQPFLGATCCMVGNTGEQTRDSCLDSLDYCDSPITNGHHEMGTTRALFPFISQIGMPLAIWA